MLRQQITDNDYADVENMKKWQWGLVYRLIS